MHFNIWAVSDYWFLILRNTVEYSAQICIFDEDVFKLSQMK
uniref:Uncharacterized protein n=1 Tax=Arundo donax TaxID=35708 RepID=A0A0A8Y5P2_ARUDO